MTQNNNNINNDDDNVNRSVVRHFRHARSCSPWIHFPIIGGAAALFTLILCSLLTGNLGFAISFASAQEQDDNNDSRSGQIIVVVPVRHGDQSFDVRASITNGITIKEIIVDQDFASLVISLENNSNDTAAPGILVISLPRSLIDAKAAADSNSEAAPADDVFVVVSGPQELDYNEVRTTDTERELRISIPPNSSEIEIVGTQVMPEFPFPLLAFAVIVAVMTVISKQRRGGLRISKSQGVSFRL